MPGPTPELRDEQPPDWSPVTDPPPSRRRQRAATLGRTAIGVAIAGLMWWLGHEPAAVVLVCVLGVLTIASLRSARVAATVERVVHAIQRVAGNVLSVILLGTIQLLVITPVWALMRLFRHNPLALGAKRDADSLWRPVPKSRRELHRRPFAYELMPDERHSDGLPLPRVRLALGFALLLLLLDLGLGAIANQVNDPVPDHLGGLVAQDVPAGAGEDWRVELGSEIDGLWKSKSYDPYLSWTVPDFEGRHVNVGGGVRRSYQPAGSGSADAPTVLFLGGSSMFGLYQRDLHTIPSAVARLAEADGIPIRVVNRGALAYVNWQEMLLLQQLAASDDAPDLAVFYDGFNELLAQFQLGEHGEFSHLEADEIDRRLGLGQRGSEFDTERPLPETIYRSWTEVSLLHRAGRKLGVVSTPTDRTANAGRPLWPDQSEDPARKGRLAAAIHARGVEQAQRLGRSYGFDTAFFWQPNLYGKQLQPGERGLRGWLGTDPDAWQAAGDAARARLAPAVVDLSAALDAVSTPVMYDFVHTNEEGARVMAAAIYERLRPQLEELSGR